jgi:nucleotide-binding universal stress UspA family protein
VAIGTIVVGVDGSPGGDAALRWALAEARLRGSRLRVVHAYAEPPALLTEGGYGVGGVPAPSVPVADVEPLRQAAEEQARGLIDQALRRVDGQGDRVEIEVTPAQGPPARTLIESAQGADLLVVGSRGRGGFLGLLLGSVSQQCAQHPPCPVVILPPENEGE